MTRTSPLTKRLGQVQAQHAEWRLNQHVERIARDLGIEPSELRREAEELVERFVTVGAVSLEAKVAYVAEELEMTPAALLAKLRSDPHMGHIWVD